ncbi:hypothetical protein BDC45DRAFT_501841 [Circinella umbellata]|nr:hypothetical protein BDC45DRAFT_501841 [Circinella umbellata]
MSYKKHIHSHKLTYKTPNLLLFSRHTYISHLPLKKEPYIFSFRLPFSFFLIIISIYVLLRNIYFDLFSFFFFLPVFIYSLLKK